jgi:hypothetical protein
MASKILAQAHLDKNLRDSGLFVDKPNLSDAILVGVIHLVYVLYKRESRSYSLIRLQDEGYQCLLVLSNSRKLSLGELVPIVENVLEDDKG